MTVNGKCLTARISVSPKTESECSLSDILEEQVDQKYFLSEEQIHQEEIIKFLDAMDKQKQEITDHVIKLSAHQSNYDQLKTMSKAERIPLKPKNNKKLKEYSEAVEKGIDIQLEKLLDFYWQLSPWNKQDRLPAVIKAIKKLMK
jgi:hypothetical protein